ncbi:MAG: RNA-directed DNA polymerase [Acidobacteria bacterium]|nr:RNA-directed DNA polymerase [Acidobacteriota bacterium]
MAGTYGAARYLLEDQPRTLFPLKLTRILVEQSEAALYNEIERILKTDPKKENTGFLTQIRCHAAKCGLHSRRTLKLDPVAELFVYDLVYRERATFRPSRRPDRKRFGYTFRGGRPTPATTSYGKFREAVRGASARFKYYLGVDIASYFNSIYHHDLVFWFDAGRNAKEVEKFGRYFREIVGGRSVDCLPQGLHPCKMIGADFLKRVDAHHRLKCALMLRFMDDMYLFDDDYEVLQEDFLLLQRYLGDRGLSLNAEKTTSGEGPLQAKTTIDEVKIQLLELRRAALEWEYGQLHQVGAEATAEKTEPLTEEQTEYLKELLDEDEIDEEDAELVLSLVGERAEDALDQLIGIFEDFPALARSVYAVAGHIGDKTELCAQLGRIAKERRALTEDQLFWATKIAEDYLGSSHETLELVARLHSHPASTDLTKAKVLEIPWADLDDMREEYLKGGRSDWLAWSSAIGTRRVARMKRNQLLKYYGKASPMNQIVAGCVRRM